MNNDKTPCCAADVLRRTRKIPVNRVMTGITMPDESIAAVRELDLGNDSHIRDALMKKIRVYNYVPPVVSEAYTRTIMHEYTKTKADDR